MRLDRNKVIALIKNEFGLAGNLHRLPGYADDNFHLQDTENEFVIKFAGADTELGELEMQNAALDHLQQYCPELELPRVQRNHHSQSVVKVAINDQSRWLRVLSYVKGSIYAELEHPAEELQYAAGELLGKIDQCLSGFQHSETSRLMDWDLMYLERLAPHVECIADIDARAQVKLALTGFIERVTPVLSELPKQVIHNDANDYNLVINQKLNRQYPLSLIDFGDLMYSIRSAELAILLSYMMFGQSDPLAVARKVTRGYLAHMPLLSVELDLLFQLINGRLCNSLIMSSRSARQRPDDKYIMISAKPAMALLEFMQNLGEQQFIQQLELDL